MSHAVLLDMKGHICRFLKPFNECKQLFDDDGQQVLLVAAMQTLHWTLIPNHVSKTSPLMLLAATSYN